MHKITNSNKTQNTPSTQWEYASALNWQMKWKIVTLKPCGLHQPNSTSGKIDKFIEKSLKIQNSMTFRLLSISKIDYTKLIDFKMLEKIAIACKHIFSYIGM